MVTHTYQRGCCVSTNDDGPACATCEKARDELDVSPVQELYDDDVAHGIFLLVAMLAEGPRPSPLCTECRSTLVQGPQGWHCTAEATCDFCGEISHVFHLPTAHGAPDYVCVKCVKRSMFGKPASGRSVEPHPSERGADHSEIASPEQAEPTPASGPAVSGEPRRGIPRCAMCGHDQDVHNWVPLAGGCSIIGCTCLRFAAIRGPTPTSAPAWDTSRLEQIAKAGSEGPLPHSPPNRAEIERLVLAYGDAVANLVEREENDGTRAEIAEERECADTAEAALLSAMFGGLLSESDPEKR